MHSPFDNRPGRRCAEVKPFVDLRRVRRIYLEYAVDLFRPYLFLRVYIELPAADLSNPFGLGMQTLTFFRRPLCPLNRIADAPGGPDAESGDHDTDHDGIQRVPKRRIHRLGSP